MRRDEYRLMKYTLARRAVVMLAVLGFLLVTVFYSILRGTGIFSALMVRLMTLLFLGNENLANNVYYTVFRQNSGVTMLVGIFVLFLACVSIYLRIFVKYFKDIDRGIDCLLRDDDSEADLVPEMEVLEKKLNSAKLSLRRQRQQLAVEEQRKNDLIMYLAHDLKTPLASVIGYLTLLRDEENISPKLRRKYLNITLDKAERLEELINEFFEITRFNLTHIELSWSRINLTRLLEQLVYEFAPMLREKELTCRLSGPEDVMLRCDGDKLQRVFDNLLRNAVLYSPEKSEIVITLKPGPESVTVIFQNSGEEIPEEKLARIFEQFYRLDSSRSTKSGGAGLGLAIAKQIVELHGGTITAESGPEKTVFTVLLPSMTENREVSAEKM